MKQDNKKIMFKMLGYLFAFWWFYIVIQIFYMKADCIKQKWQYMQSFFNMK